MALDTSDAMQNQTSDAHTTLSFLSTQPIVPQGLLGDPTASALHDAFLIGWSLTELRGRIQDELLKKDIAARASLLATPQKTAYTSNSSITPTMVRVLNQVESWLKEVQQLTVGAVTHSLQAVPTSSATLISDWRALFSRIGSIQYSRFPASSTTDTMYEPPPDPSYLQEMYANTGIISLKNNALSEFRLYQTTRRTLNCLTLLYTNLDESLISDVIGGYQNMLVRKLLDIPAPDATEQESEISSANMYEAIKLLSGLTFSLLELWDSYLRENYYSGGSIPNNELELVAYEAGRSIAQISWCATTKVEPLERALAAAKHAEKATQNTAQGTSQLNSAVLEKQLKKAWMDIFDQRSIIHIQHQLSALKTALDNAYMSTNKQGTLEHEDSLRPNLSLPSSALQAVVKSLDYWQAGIAWICTQADIVWVCDENDPNANTPEHGCDFSRTLRLALIEQADVWQSLILCQQSLQSFSLQSITQKITDTFMTNFQTVASQGLKQVAQTTAQDVGDVVNEAKKDVFRQYGSMLIGAGIAMLVVLGILVALFFLVPGLGDALKPVLTGLIGVAVVALGGGGGAYIKNMLNGKNSTSPGAAPPQNEQATAPSGSALLNNFSDFVSSFGSTIMSDFEHGYQQILVEFDCLNHNVSVTFPLIEFLVVHSSVKDDYDFLTTVVWTDATRKQEIEHIAQAAFGPIGAFVGARVSMGNQTEHAA